MFYLYKTLYYPYNTKAEYQKQGKHWVKRIKGSKGEWEAMEEQNAKIMDNHFKEKGRLYFYNDTIKYGVLALIIGLGAYSYIYLKKHNALQTK